MGKYILSVGAAGLMGGILNHLTHSQRSKELMKLLTGVFVMLSVVRPLFEIRLPDFDSFWQDFSNKAQAAAAMGTAEYEAALSKDIIQRSEAYILEQAEILMDTPPTVCVSVNESSPPSPWEVLLQGKASPEEKEALSTWIAENLGIPQERQVWIGWKNDGS